MIETLKITEEQKKRTVVRLQEPGHIAPSPLDALSSYQKGLLPPLQMMKAFVAELNRVQEDGFKKLFGPPRYINAAFPRPKFWKK